MKGRILGVLAALIAVTVLASCSVPLVPEASQSKAPALSAAQGKALAASGKRVVGYFVEWGIYAAHDSYYVTSIPFDKLTHINYAFVGINPSTLAVEIYDPWATTDIVYPGMPWDTPYKGNLGMLRKAKIDHPGLKVLISVGGWTKSHGFHAAAATPASRATVANNLVAFMKQYGLDGVDIDWEYPGVNRPADPNDPYDKGSPGGPEDKVNFTLFLQAIRQKLDQQGAADGGVHYELTYAAGIGYDKIELTEPQNYAQYLDAINLMTYDMHGGFESVIGHQAPLYANPNDTHDPLVNERYNIDWAVNKFLSYGIPSSKIVLGLPFYSRGWNNVAGGWDVDGNGTPDGMFGTGSGSLAGKWGIGGQGPYFTMKQLQTQAGWEKYRDPYSKVPWIYNRSTKELYTFDDPTSITTKMDYVLSKNLGGAMYWELDGDDWKNGYDLVNIVAEKMLGGSTGDTQAPTTPGNFRSTGTTQSSVSLAWNASTDNVGVVAYDISWTGGSTSVTGTSATVSNLSAATSYAFSIKARDAAGNSSAPVTVNATTNPATPDNQAPSMPTGLASSNITSNSVTLSWNASTDNVGVSAYDVLQGSTVVASPNSTSTTVTGLSANTPYSFSVRAKDAAGNISAASNPVSVTTSNTTPDGPATGVPGAPSLSQTTWNGEASYTIKMDMWWGNNGTSYQLFENGILVATRSLTDASPSAQTVSIAFSGKANGSYQYVGKLTNRFGTTTSNTLTYTVTQGSTNPSPQPSIAPSPSPQPSVAPSPSPGTYPAWALNTAYALGARVSYQGHNYECTLAHTSYSETWNPPSAPTLWRLLN